MRRLSSGKRGATLLITIALCLQGCAIPGVTHSWKVTTRRTSKGVAFSPDSTQLALVLEVNRFRDSKIWPFAVVHYEPCSFELYVYDIAKHVGPKRVHVWSRQPNDQMSLYFWDENGIVVDRVREHWNPDTKRFDRDEHADRFQHGAVHAIATDQKDRLLEEYRHYHPGGSIADALESWHIDEFAGEFFLWHPKEHQRELLFSLPINHGGYRDVVGDQEMRIRESRRRADTIHLIRDISARTEGDSIRVMIGTYVPRPGYRARAYVIHSNLQIPDTSAWRQGIAQSADHLLPDFERTLGPQPETLEFRLACRDLRSALLPSLRSIGHDREREEYTGIWVRLIPQDIPPEDERMYPGIYDGSVSDTPVSIVVPIH